MIVILAMGFVMAASAHPASYALTPLGVTINTTALGQPALALEVASASSFRLGVAFNQVGAPALPSPSLDPARAPAPFTVVKWGAYVGVQTSFGALVATAEGDWLLLNANNATLVASTAPTLDATAFGTVRMAVNSSVIAAEPCLGNGLFSPPFVWGDGVFAMAVSPWDFDPSDPAQQYVHCHPVGFNAASMTELLAARLASCDPNAWEANTDADGCVPSSTAPLGTATADAADCCARCDSDCSTWVWANASAAAPSGVNCWLCSSVTGSHASSGRTLGGDPPSPQGRQGWWATGFVADWYLAPAAAGYDFTRAYFELTGPPAVPPRYTMAFMATYWGYDTMDEVVTNMTAFRDGNYPIDSFIMDYDWFGPDACGPANCQGGYCCGDFGYRPDPMFGNNTFNISGQLISVSGATDLLALFHSPPLNMHWAGIRKPRTYSNVELSNQSGWLLPDKDGVGAGNNNFNYTIAEMRAWYAVNHEHFLDDGVDFWWFDEGETQWFTYLYWNMAAQQTWLTQRPDQRMFTVNRAFQPGMQRFPASTWSGDNQDCSHTMALRFTMYGQPYVACDMTSPSATVLVRQYQNAVFLSIMRVHQMHGVPRFPFLWGGPEHQDAFRKALNMRYALLPHVYSLSGMLMPPGRAHEAHRDLRPISRPASFEFADDGADSIYMFGRSIIAGEVSTANNPDPNENTTSTRLPTGVWFRFNSTASLQGPTQLVETNVALDYFPVFVRAGAILVLNGAPIQFSEQECTSLVVHVYAGADATFISTEDDGLSLAYQRGWPDGGCQNGLLQLIRPAGALRATMWTWTDSTAQLTWTVAGSYAGPNVYTTVQVAGLCINSSNKRY